METHTQNFQFWLSKSIIMAFYTTFTRTNCYGFKVTKNRNYHVYTIYLYFVWIRDENG